jgi:oxalate decarboxylase/phosphoglucose isomerase-like protein (cupin superfamily)
MTPLNIIKADDVAAQNLRGQPAAAGSVKRIVATEKFFFNIDEVSPGHSPHHWHRHTKYVFEGNEIEYPDDFEEIYFILSGHGVVQWKAASGAIHEQAVGPGDTIHMPPDVVEHQLFNNGSETIRLAVVGVPPTRKRPLASPA